MRIRAIVAMKTLILRRWFVERFYLHLEKRGYSQMRTQGCAYTCWEVETGVRT